MAFPVYSVACDDQDTNYQRNEEKVVVDRKVAIGFGRVVRVGGAGDTARGRRRW